MTMYGVLHSKSDIGRLYVKKRRKVEVSSVWNNASEKKKTV